MLFVLMNICPCPTSYAYKNKNGGVELVKIGVKDQRVMICYKSRIYSYFLLVILTSNENVGLETLSRDFFFFYCIVSYLDTFLTVEVKVQNVPKATDAKNMEERRKLFLHTKKGISAKTHQKKNRKQ